MKLERKNTYHTPIVFIDGHGSSGKEKISRALEYFDGVEKSKEDEIFYCIHKLYEIGEMDKATATTMLRTIRDKILYYQMVGRDINFRRNDVTSLFKHPNPNKYITRAFSDDEHGIINREILTEQPIFQNMITNALCNFDIFYEAFGDDLKFIYMLRNPALIIKNLFLHNYGERIGIDPMEIQFSFRYHGRNIPLYAQGWEKEYESITPLERLIHMFRDYQEADFKKYRKLPLYLKSSILFIDFDDFSLHSNTYFEKIGKHLGRDYSPKIRDLDIYPQDYQEVCDMMGVIQTGCKEKYVDMFVKIVKEYEEFKDEFIKS